MLKRYITDFVHKSVSQMPAVALLGARQVGKTTLAKTFMADGNAIYMDLENPRDLLRLDDPLAFFAEHADKLIILDEIQRMPNMFTTLRGMIDTNRANGRRVGQFLLLGSASMDLMRQSSESLAGRVRYVHMGGLNVLEIGKSRQDMNRLLLRGGFPESYLAVDDSSAMDWVHDLISTYLERDILQMGFNVPADRLRRLWAMLAHLQGETVNVSTLATNLEVQRATVNHYLDILTDLLLVRKLQPYHANVKKRLVKSPRYYIRDTGIQNCLLGIENHDALLSNPILGKSWEAFIIENIHSVLPKRAETYFYRTQAGAEIDLIIKFPTGDIWAIEIKYGQSPKISKHFHTTCQDIEATQKYIIYGGNDTFPIRNGVVITGIKAFMERLGEY